MNDLNRLTLDYIHFMSCVGRSTTEQEYKSDIANIFEENVSKIENGKLILQGRESLFNQLIMARSFAFPWKIKVLDVMWDQEKNVSAVRFSWDSKEVGLHITTAILKFNSNGKIREINEVYNKFAEISH